MDKELTDLLIRHEGFRKKAYFDSIGKITIGIGRNVSDNGVSQDEALYLLNNDINGWVLPTLKKIFKDFDKYSQARKYALISMLFNLGETRFLDFKQMIEAIKVENWPSAAEQTLASKWAKQVGNRAIEIAHALLKG